mmetsp:Transcript_10737/g.34125  ORF Transcript_10737/g.34125 Transcript_10737/m.34125 type:complete len:225 (-) Transcript_10737:444-1118(-)
MPATGTACTRRAQTRVRVAAGTRRLLRLCVVVCPVIGRVGGLDHPLVCVLLLRWRQRLPVRRPVLRGVLLHLRLHPPLCRLLGRTRQLEGAHAELAAVERGAVQLVFALVARERGGHVEGAADEGADELGLRSCAHSRARTSACSHALAQLDECPQRHGAAGRQELLHAQQAAATSGLHAHLAAPGNAHGLAHSAGRLSDGAHETAQELRTRTRTRLCTRCCLQ